MTRMKELASESAYAHQERSGWVSAGNCFETGYAPAEYVKAADTAPSVRARAGAVAPSIFIRLWQRWSRA